MDPEGELTSQNMGRSGNPFGGIITGDAVQNLRNHAAWQQGKAERDQAEQQYAQDKRRPAPSRASRASRAGGGSTGGGIDVHENGPGLTTLAEGGLLYGFAVYSLWRPLKALAASQGMGEFGLALALTVGGALALWLYAKAVIWFVGQARWLAFGSFGLLWAFAVYHLAHTKGVNAGWTAGMAILAGLFAFAEKKILADRVRPG